MKNIILYIGAALALFLNEGCQSTCGRSGRIMTVRNHQTGQVVWSGPEDQMPLALRRGHHGGGQIAPIPPSYNYGGDYPGYTGEIYVQPQPYVEGYQVGYPYRDNRPLYNPTAGYVQGSTAPYPGAVFYYGHGWK